MKAWMKIAIAAILAAAMVAFVCMIIIFPKENDPKMIQKMDIEKYASPALTVSEGGEITYTVKITSRAGRRALLVVKDTLPENTVLVGGDFVAEGSALSAEVTVKAKGSASVSYTVRLGDAYTNGSYVNAPAASIGDKKTGECKSLVARTLKDSEQDRMRDAILALTYSEDIAPIKLLRDIYLVAFSEAPRFEEALTPDQLIARILAEASADTEEAERIESIRASVIPTLFGGSALSDAVRAKLVGTSAVPKLTDFVIGDILLVEKNKKTDAYIFDGSALISVMNGCTPADGAVVLSDVEKADRYVALRPSVTLATLNSRLPEDTADLTEAQKALLATARAYLLRGYRLQYDDSRMMDAGEYRWQIGQYAPEDYTEQKWGYVNCAAFTYECYRNALGIDLGRRYTTRNLVAHYTDGGAVGAPEYPYFFNNTSLNVSEADRIAEEKKFTEALEVGDLVVIIRKGGYGHVMMYIGNGVLVHSSGASFGYSKDQETYEPTIRYMNVWGYLFDPSSTNYLFREVEDADSGAMRNYIYSLSIVRPLDSYDGEIPKNTLNRMQNLSDIYSEKLSSHPEGKTANIGEKITYTFRVKNLGREEKTVAVEELLPSGVTLDSKGDFSEKNGKLTASVKVLPGETKEVSYSVTVTGDASVIGSVRSLIGGVAHSCPKTKVAKTLTEEEQKALLSAVEKMKKSNPQGLVGFALVDAIYAEAGLASAFSETDVHRSLFRKPALTQYELNEESAFYSMVVPTLYGGRRYFTPQRYTATSKINSDRSRLPREQALVIGDIVVVKFNSSEALYMYTGEDHLLSLSTPYLASDTYSTSVRLMRMMSVGNYYAILRPSLG